MKKGILFARDATKKLKQNTFIGNKELIKLRRIQPSKE